MSLTYSLLLALDHGPATVVENLTASQITDLRVTTPVTKFLEELPRMDAPRHVFLTGNAGDGKTFAVKSALASDPNAFGDFQIINDAAAVHRQGSDPISALAEDLAGALRSGRRLLVASNRGQLERLERHVSSGGAGGSTELGELLKAAVSQLALQISPSDEGTDDVLVLDLGLVDTLAPEIVDPLLDQLATARPDPEMSGPAGAALEASCAALREPIVRAEIRRGLNAIRGLALHVTMRQLWSFGAYLLTGWRASNDERPLGIADSILARLYSESAEGALIENLRRRADPALVPRPGATSLALKGQLGAALRARSELAILLPEGSQPKGSAALRAAAAYGVGDDWQPAQVVSSYQKAIDHLRSHGASGWTHAPTVTRSLLKGIFKALSLPTHGNQFPRWMQLCYDVRRLGSATMVANEHLDAERFQLALPRPSPAAERAFANAWAPPYLLMAPVHGASVGARLRIGPALFARLYSSTDPVTTPLSDAAAEVIRRWLAQSAVGAREFVAESWLASRRHGTIETLTRDPLAATLSF